MDRGNHRGIAPTNHQIWIRMAFVLICVKDRGSPPMPHTNRRGHGGTATTEITRLI